MTESFRFLSADGKTQIHAVRLAPEGEPRFAVQLVHGMAEHIARYSGFAEFLAANGILVVGHDHLGHGETAASDELLGYVTEENPSGVLVEDMHALRVLTQKEHPGLPYFMLGHSMGSYLLRKYLALHGEGLAGAVIMGTGFVSPAVAGLGVRLCGLTAIFRGWKHRSLMLGGLALGGGPYKKFDTTGTEPERSWLTRDAEIVRRYYADPRCGFLFTASGFRALFEAVAFACKPENAARIPKDVPLLVTSGEQDPVGDLGEGVKKADRMFREAGIRDVTLKLWPDCRHEILNELNREEVYAFILDWFNGRAAGAEAHHEA